MGSGEALIRLWSGRSGRERMALLVGATVVAVAALYAFLWDPGLAARKTLSATLPKLRAQVQDMRAQQKEIVALRKASPVSPRAADLRALLRASAERSALAQSLERIEWRPGEKVLVTAASVAFDDWLEWLYALQAELGVRLDACEIRALGPAGTVRVEATFVRSAP